MGIIVPTRAEASQHRLGWQVTEWGQGPVGTQTLAQCHSWWARLALNPSQASVRCFLTCGQHLSPCPPTLVLPPLGAG